MQILRQELILLILSTYIIFYTEVKAICEAFMDVIKIFLEMISENHEKNILGRAFSEGREGSA